MIQSILTFPRKQNKHKPWPWKARETQRQEETPKPKLLTPEGMHAQVLSLRFTTKRKIGRAPTWPFERCLACSAERRFLVTKKTSHSVRLIKNTCDFLLKQLGMFLYPREKEGEGAEGTKKRKIVQHLAFVLGAMFPKINCRDEFFRERNVLLRNFFSLVAVRDIKTWEMSFRIFISKVYPQLCCLRSICMTFVDLRWLLSSATVHSAQRGMEIDDSLVMIFILMADYHAKRWSTNLIYAFFRGPLYLAPSPPFHLSWCFSLSLGLAETMSTTPRSLVDGKERKNSFLIYDQIFEEEKKFAFQHKSRSSWWIYLSSRIHIFFESSGAF